MFFYFPSRHSWEQALSFSGAFSSCPKRHCKGRPFQLQIKKQLFRPWKVVFLFSLLTLLGARTELLRCFFQLPKAPLQITNLPFQTVFESRHWAFQMLFQLSKAPLQRETLPIANWKKTTFRAPKSCFFQKWFWAPEMLYPSHMCTRLGQKSWYIPFLRQKGSPTSSKKNNFLAPKSCFFQKRFWAPEMLYPSHMPTRLGQKSWYIPFFRQKGSPTGLKKKQLFGLRKVVFFKSGFWAPEMLYPSHMPTRLGQQSWYIRFLRQKGSSTGSKKKNNFSKPEKLFFFLSGWTHFFCLYTGK